MTPRLILVGGYLGAGKTTLLLRAAAVLQGRGVRVGLVMNDQGVDLVDSALAAEAGCDVREVTGSCFCCNLPDLVDQLRSLAAAGAEVILAEPVGSCTDIVRTVVHPLQEMAGEWDVAPFTVLVDVSRAETMRGASASDLAYLFEQQMAEADLVVASKADVAGACPFPVAARVSGRSGTGVGEWLDLVLHRNTPAGLHPVDVDYQRYGSAEASLSWMNFRATVRCHQPSPALRVVGPFFDAVVEVLRREQSPVAHVKALVSNPGGSLRAAVCGDGEVALEGTVIGDPHIEHRLLLNLRAECAPEVAREALGQGLQVLSTTAEVIVEREQCFRPSPPRPSVWTAKPIG